MFLWTEKKELLLFDVASFSYCDFRTPSRLFNRKNQVAHLSNLFSRDNLRFIFASNKYFTDISFDVADVKEKMSA